MILLLINVLGLALIFMTAWWFWFSKPRTVKQTGSPIEIKVKNGVYQPSYIEAQVDHPLTLRFIREDASHCAEMVIFNQLNINQKLPVNIPSDISLTLKQPGEYEFTCQMGMYRGKLIVK